MCILAFASEDLQMYQVFKQKKDLDFLLDLPCVKLSAGSSWTVFIEFLRAYPNVSNV